MNKLNIHDIKPLVIVDDYSLYLFILMIVLSIVTVCILFYILYKYLKKRKAENKKHIIKNLKDLNLTNSKEASYLITHYIRQLNLNELQKSNAIELFEQLEKYKYKKNVENLSAEDKKMFNLFLRSL